MQIKIFCFIKTLFKIIFYLKQGPKLTNSTQHKRLLLKALIYFDNNKNNLKLLKINRHIKNTT